MQTFAPLCTDVVTEHCGNAIVHHRAGLDCQQILDTISAQGEVLKTSPKSITRRIDALVVKACAGGAGLGLLNRSLRRNRYRRGWFAGLYLEKQGVAVPRVKAFVETGRWGLIAASYLVMDYLEKACNVERYAVELVQDEAPEEDIRTFLRGLARAVNELRGVGAYHQDLSGKNIYTRDGERFHFIDLESIVPAERHTRKMIFRNHVQLYDSFCDLLGDDLLEPFLAEMAPEEQDYAMWAKLVRRGQAARRTRQVAIWRRQGRSL